MPLGMAKPNARDESVLPPPVGTVSENTYRVSNSAGFGWPPRATSQSFPAASRRANFLGFTTQSAGRGEVATSGFRLPRKLLGSDTIVHTRRPDAWQDLSEADAATPGCH